MRALIFFVMLLVLITMNYQDAKAEPANTKFTALYQTEAGTAGLTATAATAVSTKTLSVDGSTGTLSPRATLRGGVDQTQPDFSRYLIEDQTGTLTPLSRSYFGQEYVARAGIDLYFHDLSFAIDGAETANDTPFPGANAKFLAAYTVNSRGSKFSIELARSDYQSPLSYFVDPDTFQTHTRPQRSLEDRLTIAADQILSETLKTRIELFNAERPSSRPPAEGAEATLGWAFRNDSALIGKLGLAHELRSAQLFDDRGYFDASWAQIEYRFEPGFNWTISGVLGTVLETESPRGTLPQQNIGTDSVGLQTRVFSRLWEVGIQALNSTSNTGYQSFQVAGDLKWQI